MPVSPRCCRSGRTASCPRLYSSAWPPCTVSACSPRWPVPAMPRCVAPRTLGERPTAPGASGSGPAAAGRGPDAGPRLLVRLLAGGGFIMLLALQCRLSAVVLGSGSGRSPPSPRGTGLAAVGYRHARRLGSRAVSRRRVAPMAVAAPSIGLASGAAAATLAVGGLATWLLVRDRAPASRDAVPESATGYYRRAALALPVGCRCTSTATVVR